MAKRKQSEKNTVGPEHAMRYALWAAAFGGWLLLVAALLSYDPADWPGHAVAPHHVQVHNWAGRTGALVTHHLYLMLGPGVWIAVCGLCFGLALLARGKKISQAGLRGLGLLLMTVTASGLVAQLLPQGESWIGVSTWMPGWVQSMVERPEGPGGLFAYFVNNELSLRFGGLGTGIIVLVAFWIGAILTADELVVAAPKKVAGLAKAAGRVGGGAGVGIAGAVSQLRSHSKSTSKQKFKASRQGRWGRRRDTEEIELNEETGGLGATESFDLPGSRSPKRPVDIEEDEQVQAEQAEGLIADDGCEPEVEGEEEIVVDDVDEELNDAHESDAPAAYSASKKDFDPDALRAKIKQLPIHFAGKVKVPSVAGAAREIDVSGYQFPDLSILEDPESNFTEEMEGLVRDQALELESALQQYRIDGEVVGIDSGPVITLFEVRLAPGTKVAQLNSISSDLARALRAHNIRIVPNMAGKDTVGIEVPNLKKERVRLKELMSRHPEAAEKMRLPMFLGKDASGNSLIADLAAMPHMLIAGTTGSGKSVCMNGIIASFLFTKRPDELKLVLVDPKMVEMSMFKDIPHLMCPVVTEMPKASAILEWATTKMDERYELLAEAGVRDIAGYNRLTWEELKERFEPSTEEEEARIPKKLPYLVFVIDELADLMMTAKEVEGFIVRLAQKSRAVGMHLILATQRPQANVVTGLIKSNMPCRISFKVASAMDSRIVLDQKGAELLLGHGDMLFLSPRTSKLVRAQGTLMDDLEIRKTVKFLKTVSKQSFEPQLVQIKSPGAFGEGDDERDPLFDDAVRVVLQSRRGSVSLLQRRLNVGYSRASRLIEQMGTAGIIGEYKGTQSREVNLTLEEWDAMAAQAAADAQAQSEGLGGVAETDVEEDEDLEDIADGDSYEEARESVPGEEDEDEEDEYEDEDDAEDADEELEYEEVDEYEDEDGEELEDEEYEDEDETGTKV